MSDTNPPPPASPTGPADTPGANGVTPPATKPLPNVVQACPAGTEQRLVVVAFGYGFRPIDTNRDLAAELVAKGLDASKLTRTGDGFLYDARKTHGVTYGVKYVYTTADFNFYLHAPYVHLVYMGHSREGRGVCFRDKSTAQTTGEYWGDLGISKIGYRYIGVPVSDITEHKYKTVALLASQPRPSQSECEPHNIGPHYGELTSVSAGVPGFLEQNDYWGWGSTDADKSVIVQSGAGDYDGTKPRSRVLCLFSCSTAQYWRPTVQASTWTPSGDHGFVYYTSDTDLPSDTVLYWLFHLMNYTSGGVLGPWKTSLDDALQRTNAEIELRHRMGEYDTQSGGAVKAGWSIVT